MKKTDDVWQQLHDQSIALAEHEPLLASYYHASVINHDTFESALAFHVASKLDSTIVSGLMLNEVFIDVLRASPAITHAARADIVAYFERDPACDNYCRPFFFFKGYVAVQAQRFSHYLWLYGRRALARYIHHQVSIQFDVDIHPGARLGEGLMIDHATGLVIGETAVVGDNVSLMHGVTLGGTGSESGQRHPRIGTGVLISSGAKVLGNISVGEGVKIGAGSVVLESVPPHVTVAGVPARIVGRPAEQLPALSMDQNIESE